MIFIFSHGGKKGIKFMNFKNLKPFPLFEPFSPHKNLEEEIS